MSLDVLHADNHVLAVAKPAGLPIVPDASGDRSLLDEAKAWIAREYDKPGAVFLGVVHRLDRPVSGVVCFARTSKSAKRLSAAFRDRRVDKLYLGLGLGPWPAGQVREGDLRQWLRKDRGRNRVHAWSTAAEAPEDAKVADTRYRRLAGADERWLLRLEPRTGRSHQLRVAARALGVPLAGDLRYGVGLEPLADRSIGLHARRLVVPHPTLGEPVVLEAPLPPGAWWDPWRDVDPDGPAT